MFYTDAVELLERVRDKVDGLKESGIDTYADIYNGGVTDSILAIDEMIAIYKKLPNDAIKDGEVKATGDYNHDGGC